MRWMIRLSLPALLLLAGCGDDEGANAGAGAGVAGGPTWHTDIAPLLTEKCVGCHQPGNIAPFSLMEFEDAAPIADWLVATVDSGVMPPWGALETDECEPTNGWKYNPRLSDDEFATLRAWADAGAPEGDAASAKPLPAAIDLSLSDATQRLTPEKGWVASGDQDQFRCFVLDPELTDWNYLTGLQVEPDNRDVVHHALIFLIEPYSDAQDELANNRDLQENGSYECFSPPGGFPLLIGAWAPGSLPMQTPPNTAIPAPPGSKILLNVHYHPTGAPAREDKSTVALRWQKAAPDKAAFMLLIGNSEDEEDGLLPGDNDPMGDDGNPLAEFKIPAGVSQHREVMEVSIDFPDVIADAEIDIWAAGTHMHYVGTDMKIDLVRKAPQEGEPASECLVQTPKWDFNWQRWYEYDTPLAQTPKLRSGDTLRMRCTYDNSVNNPAVRAALAEQGLAGPQDVGPGEQTLDEMCLGVFGTTLPMDLFLELVFGD